MRRRLASLQGDFQAYVLEGRESVAKAISAESAQAARAGLQVYARAYELRLIEILRTDFPMLRRMAGDVVFDGLARAYIREHPSRDRNARWFARHMPAFVAARAGSLPHPAAAEMARFEWTLGLAFDASDDGFLSLDQLVAIPPAKLAAAPFRLHPSVHRIDLRWNIPAIWSAMQEDMGVPMLQAADAPVAWIVWRPESTSRFRALEADEQTALDAIARSGSLADACCVLEQLMHASAVPARAAQFVRRWVEERLLAARDRLGRTRRRSVRLSGRDG